MIKHFAKPFNVAFRSEKSIINKIENNEEIIEFLEYQARHRDVDLEHCKSRIEDLKDEVEYYEEIMRLKDNKDYIEGLIGGEIVMIGSAILGTVLGLGLRRLRK